MIHGTESHKQDEAMNKHMENMYELKERIPLKYRDLTSAPIEATEESLNRGKQLLEKIAVYVTVMAARDTSLSFFPTLTDAERWDLVNYINHLQKSS